MPDDRAVALGGGVYRRVVALDPRAQTEMLDQRGKTDRMDEPAVVTPMKYIVGASSGRERPGITTGCLRGRVSASA